MVIEPFQGPAVGVLDPLPAAGTNRDQVERAFAEAIFPKNGEGWDRGDTRSLAEGYAVRMDGELC